MTAPRIVIAQKSSPIRSAAGPAYPSLTPAHARLDVLAKRLDVGRQLPDRLARHHRPEGGHPVGPALDDGGVDVGVGSAVDPIVVREWRTDPAAARRTVTSRAVEGRVELPP